MAGEPIWMTTARSYIGTGEIPGIKHNSVIVKWWEKIKQPFRDDETPWCAAFVGAVLEDCGYYSTRSAAARSYLNWGMTMPAPAVGCVVVYCRPGSSWSGHVGFVVGQDKLGRIMTLGGNQGDAVSIAPFARERVLGYRWPKELPVPMLARLPLLVADAPSSANEA